MNKYKIIYLELYTLIELNNKEALLFNTLNNSTITTNNIKIVNLLKKLMASESGTVHLKKDDNVINEFIENLKKNYMGDVIYIDNLDNLPIQLNYWKTNYNSININKNIFDNLLELYLFINSVKSDNNNFKLYNGPFSLNEEISSDIDELNSFLDNYYGLIKDKKINLILGIIKSETECDKIHKFILKYKNVNIYTDVKYNHKLLESIAQDCNSVNIYTSFNNIKYLNKWDKLKLKKIHFLIDTEQEYLKINNFEKNYEYDYIINTNEVNEFVKSSLMFKKNELLDSKINIEEVMLKKIVNTNFYGKIFINPKGEIFSNLFFKKIGNVKNDNLKEILLKILENKNENWFLTKNKIRKCSSCNYNSLCPPVSRYELFYKKNQLCIN